VQLLFLSFFCTSLPFSAFDFSYQISAARNLHGWKHMQVLWQGSNRVGNVWITTAKIKEILTTQGK
jgi:hypothetical protein